MSVLDFVHLELLLLVRSYLNVGGGHHPRRLDESLVDGIEVIGGALGWNLGLNKKRNGASAASRRKDICRSSESRAQQAAERMYDKSSESFVATVLTPILTSVHSMTQPSAG